MIIQTTQIISICSLQNFMRTLITRFSQLGTTISRDAAPPNATSTVVVVHHPQPPSQYFFFPVEKFLRFFFNSIGLKIKGVMNDLSNAFAVLDLDVEDATVQTTIDATKDEEATVKRDKGKRKDNNSNEMIVAQHDQVDQQSLSTSSEYKLPLVWIDLEMTGLNIDIDRILEIACIITDGNLTRLIEGPDLVIHQTKECLDNMGEWCVNHHAASGLTEKVLHSTINEGEAENQVIDFVKKHIVNYTPMLAGNSVYVDFQFIKKYMPDLASLFSHVVVDVSSVKALCIRWYPKDNRRAPSKENKHRAMDDIKESIKELKFFKENIFKSSKPRK